MQFETLGVRGSKIKKNATRERIVGKVALIIESAGGIDLLLFAKNFYEGCCVILTDIDKNHLIPNKMNLVKMYGKDMVHSILMDVTKEQDVKRAVSKSINSFGGIDILVANAGFASAALFGKNIVKIVG